MTAEITILNAEAVALAADSAVSMQTERGPKVYQSANKIFALSRSQPVGLMIYDNAKFLGVPWETVAKTYRGSRGHVAFDTLEEHAQDFLSFLRDSRLLFPTNTREAWAVRTLFVLFNGMREVVDARIERHLESHGAIDHQEIRELISLFIGETAKYFRNSKRLPGAPAAKTMTSALRPHIVKARDLAWEQLPLTATDRRRLTEIAVAAFSKDQPLPVRAPNRSGVVIAGFGSKEMFPRVYDVVVEGLFRNTLKTSEHNITAVGPDLSEAVIIPFAQREIVDAFLVGVDPDLENFMRNLWHEAFEDLGGDLISRTGVSGQTRKKLEKAVEERCAELMADYDKQVGERSQSEYVSPILGAVAMLPKDELGAMAEALVNLTSFKRKVSVEAETVGGPIDVAVISRGDGFVWIKRKHYFDPKLNPQFFANRYGGRVN